MTSLRARLSSLLPALAFVSLLAAPAVATAAPPPAKAQAGGVAIRRFLLIADSSNGGGGRTQLRYPASDGQSIARVLQELGGVGSDERISLHESDRAQMQQGFARMKEMIRAARTPSTRIELVFYYSGHSDEEGLLVGGQRIGYDELRAWIEQTGADVRIAILDSCASGALTRRKGGVHRAPFLVDTSTHASGHAFLTASSANEAAQESDRIGAAFFTHHLVSGLRGAADSSRDGRVTLNEAYQYAFHETLARTEKTSGGPQHPTYDIQLAGTGDLVMTDLHGSSASLVVAEAIAGRLFVRDSNGHLVAELRKTTAYPVELGLEPGRYQITLEGEEKLWTGDVELRAGSKTNLTQAVLRSATPLVATARGDAPGLPSSDAGPAVATVTTAAPAVIYREIPVNLSLIPPLSMNGNDGGPRVKSINRFALGVVTHSDVLRGAQLSLAGNLVGEEMHGAQLAVVFNLVTGSAHGLQAAAGANIVRGDFEGMQAGASANVIGGDARALQSSAGFNLIRGKMVGLQAAAGANLALGSIRGMQAAAGFSYASEMHGLQLSVVNIGGDVEGAQIGVVNIARNVHGLQLGVVNVADDVSGAPIGLVSFVRHGYLHLEGWTSDFAPASVGLKMGSRRFYSVLAAGFHHPNSARGADAAAIGDRWTISGGIGFGGHITVNDRIYVDTDLMGWGFQTPNDNLDNEDAVLGTLRAVVGWQLAPRLAFFAGPTLNVLTSWNKQDLSFGPSFAQKVIHDGSVTVRIYPGLVAGIRI